MNSDDPTTRAIVDQFLKEAREVYGSNSISRIIVYRLFEKPGARYTPGGIARVTRVGESTITNVLIDLHKAGIVEYTVDEDDERSHIYTRTDLRDEQRQPHHNIRS